MFGSDGSPIIQYIVIFAVIFTVLAAIVFLVRRLTGGGTALQSRGARARQPRLGIVDVYELDRARQLILLRRDNVEHLLLVGGPNDVVVERNIQRGQRPLPEATLRPEPVAEPLPDPLAEAGRLPEPPRAIAEASARPVEPSFEMPVVVPPPVPHSQNAPPVRLPLDAGLIGGDEPGRDLPVPPPVVPPVRDPAPRSRAQRPALAPERVPEPAPAAEVPTPAAPVLPNLTPPPSEPRSVDPKVLSDMARQLQAAIARPSSAVTLPPEPQAVPPAASPPPIPAPPPAAPRPVDPLAALMTSFERRNEPAAPPAAPAPSSPPPSLAPKPVVPPVVKAPPPPPPIPKAAPPVPPPPRTSPPERPAPPPMPPVAEPPPQKGDAKASGNPFSVEEIEAEFARLLGRPLDKQG